MITKKEKIQKLIKDSNLNITPQRMELLSFLEESKSHPCALEVWEYLKGIFPSISRTTVYNILDTFTKLNILKAIHVDNITKYDFNLNYHSHFICKKCNKIFDVKIGDIAMPSMLTNYEVDDIEIYFKGICETCLKEEKDEC